MSEWAPPSSSDFPGQPTDGIDALLRKVERTKRELDDATNNLLKAAGMSVEPGVLRVGGSLIVEGDLEVPNGAIKNDWLENPVSYASDVASETGMAVTTTQTGRAVATLTMPPGYTVANAVVLGSASVLNDTAATQYAYLTAYMAINGTDWAWGGGQRITLSPGFRGSILAPLIRTKPDLLPGDVLTFYVKLWASADFAAEASVWAGTEASLTFSR